MINIKNMTFEQFESLYMANKIANKDLTMFCNWKEAYKKFKNEEGFRYFIKNYHDSMYDFVFSRNENMRAVKMNNKYGFINEEGREIAPCI
jgi:hypothetical protein